MLDLILSSQNELVDNFKVHKPLGSSDHNQTHFNIKVKTRNTYKQQWRRNFNRGKYKEIRTYLGNIDWNNTNYKEALNLATSEIRKSKKPLNINWQVI